MFNRIPELPKIELPKFDIGLPNPAEWATNMANSFVDGVSNRLHELIHNLIIECIDISMELCIIAGLIGAILYIFGWKKGKSVPFISYGIYLIIRILGGILIG